MLYKIPFTQMHGLGNNFVMLNENSLDFVATDIQNFVNSISNRYTGIGCDQVIIHTSPNTICGMRIFNRDGSHAQACGNATRCLAYLICKTLNVTSCIIQVDHRQLNCTLLKNDDVCANMGQVNFHDDWLLEFAHKRHKINEINKQYHINIDKAVCADVGNLHLVIFHNHLFHHQILSLSTILDQLFHSKFNLSFAKVDGHQIHLNVWERGAGHTLSCGTAACASFAAAQKNGLVVKYAEVQFSLGKLLLEYQNTDIIMTGPNTIISEGFYYYAIPHKE